MTSPSHSTGDPFTQRPTPALIRPCRPSATNVKASRGVRASTTRSGGHENALICSDPRAHADERSPLGSWNVQSRPRTAVDSVCLCSATERPCVCSKGQRSRDVANVTRYLERRDVFNLLQGRSDRPSTLLAEALAADRGVELVAADAAIPAELINTYETRLRWSGSRRPEDCRPSRVRAVPLPRRGVRDIRDHPRGCVVGWPSRRRWTPEGADSGPPSATVSQLRQGVGPTQMPTRICCATPTHGSPLCQAGRGSGVLG